MILSSERYRQKKMILTSTTPENTREIGRKIGEVCVSGDWIGLTGELGAGKTCLTQGLGAGLGVSSNIQICSPTFVIHRTYAGKQELHHLDLYRISESVELFELGYFELIESDGVCVVEWFERVPQARPDNNLVISLDIIDEQERTLEFSGKGTLFDKILSVLN